jgi:hypothetical protein
VLTKYSHLKGSQGRLQNHTNIHEVSRRRETFIQHGMHLYKLGKRQIARQITTEIKGIIEEKIDNPISMGWKLPTKRTLIASGMSHVEVQQHHLDDSIQTNKTQMDTLARQSSARTKNYLQIGPVIFLWENRV